MLFNQWIENDDGMTYRVSCGDMVIEARCYPVCTHRGGWETQIYLLWDFKRLNGVEQRWASVFFETRNGASDDLYSYRRGAARTIAIKEIRKICDHINGKFSTLSAADSNVV